MLGRPDSPPLIGWNDIPGARGCTPQTCAFRDLHAELKQLGVEMFGVSTQHLEDQQEAHARLHLPFALLNDGQLALAKALKLPTFKYRGTQPGGQTLDLHAGRRCLHRGIDVCRWRHRPRGASYRVSHFPLRPRGAVQTLPPRTPRQRPWNSRRDYLGLRGSLVDRSFP